MKRILLGLAAGVALALAAAPEAKAHGGQFRGPGGGVPPGLREPSDPTPPPPPPPTTPPPTTTPTDPSTPNPTPVTPSTPNQPPPTQTNPDPDKTPGKKAPTSFDQWVFWWNNNNDDILQLKQAIYALRVSVGSGLTRLGSETGGRSDATRPTEKAVKEVLIPALLWSMDPANHQHPDTESASYIALAKVTDDPAHIPLLMKAVGTDGKKNKDVDQIVNESAALSLGLLRRAEKGRQFDAKELDRVRDFLFEVFEDGQYQTRTRGFAMLSLGLLGDQPTTRTGKPVTGGGEFWAPDPVAGGAMTTDRIFAELKKKYSDEQLYVCALLSLSLQPPETVTREMVDVLKECGLKAKLFKESVSDVVASYAALALGRIGTAEDIPALLTALKVKQTGANVKRSAAIALGQLGKRIDGQARATLAVDLYRGLEAVKEASAKNFGIISLAYLIEADIRAERTDVINAKGVKLADEIVKIAKDGRYSERPYGALALGLIGREIGERPAILEYGQLRLASTEVLREGLSDQKMDKRARAAFAVGLGMMADNGSSKKLADVVADKAEDSELRGYAAVALGMIGGGSPEVLKAIKDAMSERSSEELRQQTAIALGLIGSKDAVPLLLKELKEAETQNVQGQIVIALAKIGDAQAIQPLVEILKDSSKPDLTRALACAGLGLIGDLELIPSLARISKDINYRAAPDVVNEVLSIL
jgi:HEAT repeat protein